MKYQALDANLFKLNRKRFTQHMKPNSIAIFHSNDQMARNGDCNFEYRQNSDLFYLSGLDQEDVVLVLYPDCPKGSEFKEIVFTKQTNEHIQIWDGHKYNKAEVLATSGIQKVFWLDEIDSKLNELILLADNVYLNSNENDRAVMEFDSRDLRLGKELKAKFNHHKFERAQPILKSLRMIKSQFEIDVMQHACNITEKAFRRVMKTIRPGMGEYEVEAEVTYEFIRNRATGHAYTPIFAGGKNACILHYIDNNEVLRDGDTILMDFGCEYANYASDMTRCIPVNGRFTPRQKAIYTAVLNVMKAATKMLRPGTNMDKYQAEVGKIMESELISVGLLDKHDVAKQHTDHPLYKKYFMHNTSHHIGLDVHDLMHRYQDMEVGMVFTVEPGIYILEEGLGIRLENDVLITEDGQYDLMANIPLEIEEIEELMNEK